MKNIIFLLAFSLVAAFIFSSCEKEAKDPDDNNDTIPTVKDPDYYVQYEGKKYEVNNCIALYKQSSSVNFYRYQINVVPKSVSWNTWLEALTGTGTGIVFTIITDTQNKFAYDSYKIDTTNSIAALWEMYSAHLVINGDFFMSSGTNVNLKHGTCKITNITGNTYEINGTFRTDDNKEVKVYLKGPLSVFIDPY